jgi:hypothetical protein
MTVTQNKEPQMDAWAMATSILVGLTKAEATAEAELAQRRANANQNPFGAGVTQALNLLRTLQEAKQSYEHDLRQIARSSRLPMPE